MKQGLKTKKNTTHVFRTSSFCGPGNCIAVAMPADGQVIVCDTKSNRTLVFTRAEWQAFIKGAQNHEFDVKQA